MQRAELITRQDRCFRRPRGLENVVRKRYDRVELSVDGFWRACADIPIRFASRLRMIIASASAASWRPNMMTCQNR